MKLSATLIIGTLLVFAAHAQEQSNSAYTKEQVLIFGTKHLINIDSKATLSYEFSQRGLQTEKLEDTIKLTISDIHPDNSKTLQVQFLSGKHEKKFPEIEKFSSNPMIMYFLQWDVEKMSAETETSWHYFQRVIRLGFRQAQSEKVTVTYQQNPHQGYRVFFTPMKNENTAKYGKYLDKLYEFTFIDDIPGTLYSIETRIPDPENRQNIEYTQIKFKELEPLPSRKLQ